MANGLPNVFVDVHPSKAKQTLFRDRVYFLIASTVSANSIRQMLLRVVVDGCTRLLSNPIYDHCSSRCDIMFRGI
jgi:hypothetical protein